jgi:hypothetical protein
MVLVQENRMWWCGISEISEIIDSGISGISGTLRLTSPRLFLMLPGSSYQLISEKNNGKTQL